MQSPSWLLQTGAKLLNAIADYLVSPDKPVLPGDVFHVPGFGPVRLVPAEPQDPIFDHYDHERWAVVSAPDECPCPYCEALGAGRTLQ